MKSASHIMRLASRALRSLIRTIRRSRLKAGVLALSGLIAGSAVSYFFPGVWRDIRATFIDDKPVEVTLLNHPVSLRTQGAGAAYLPAFVVPGEADELTPPPGFEAHPEERFEWAKTLGGVDANFTQVKVVVRGTSSGPVILQDLRVNVVDRQPPLEGIYVPPSGGDLVDVRWVNVALDESPPRISGGEGFIPGEGKWNFPLQVTESETEVFYIVAATESCDCRWTAELFYLANGQEESITIDNDGRPFRTTARSNATSSCQSHDGRTLECGPVQ
ncbi:MAG: hypothetical protein ACRDJL_04620 [Actinomycetota bacterium]